MNAPADLIVSSDWTYHFRDKVGFPERFGFRLGLIYRLGSARRFPSGFSFPGEISLQFGKGCVSGLSPEDFVSGKFCLRKGLYRLDY